MTLTYLLLAILLVVLEGIYEGLKYRGWHKVSGVIEFIFLAVVTISAYLWVMGIDFPYQGLTIESNWWKILVGYLLFRFGIFDKVLNIAMGVPFDYVGSTKWYDNIVGWLQMKLGAFFSGIRLCCFIAGTLILFYGNTDRILN